MSEVRGQLVFVRGPDGHPLIRRVWHAEDSTITVCTEPAFQQLQRGDASAATEAVGPDDVYEYDAEAAVMLESGGGDFDWSTLSRWRDES